MVLLELISGLFGFGCLGAFELWVICVFSLLAVLFLDYLFELLLAGGCGFAVVIYAWVLCFVCLVVGRVGGS